jgi:hypothetical protein
MHVRTHFQLLFILLLITGIFVCSDVQSESGDTTNTINFPLPNEVLSLYGFAEIRVETDKTETPPVDFFKKNFQPVNQIFQKDSLRFDDSVQSVWFKFTVQNNSELDTSVALIFLKGIHKALLYKSEGEKLIFIGKTGFFLAVTARTIPYEDNRIDMALKGHSQTNYFIQIPRVGSKLIYNAPIKTPVLERIPYAEMKAFNREKEVNRPSFLWNHFFTGVFFMFFVFGFIKYLVFGNVLKNNTYPLSVSAERLSQALCIAEHVKKLDAVALRFQSEGQRPEFSSLPVQLRPFRIPCVLCGNVFPLSE